MSSSNPAQPKARCQRTYRVYTKCCHSFIAPPCTCCPEVDFDPIQADSSYHFQSDTVKRISYKSGCPDCILAAHHTAVEEAGTEYRNAMIDHPDDLLGDAVQSAYAGLAKARRRLVRRQEMLARAGHVMDGWEKFGGEAFSDYPPVL